LDYIAPRRRDKESAEVGVFLAVFADEINSTFLALVPFL
jgi:hypothetical protein